MNIIRLIARALVILYSMFLAVFAFDEGLSIGALIHLVPAMIVIATLMLFWRSPKISAASLGLLALIATYHYHTYRDWISFLIITLPLLTAGILFWISSYQKNLPAEEERLENGSISSETGDVNR